MRRRRHLVLALADPGFRRLFAVRLAAQFGDGVFQAGLAGAVLFSPERSAKPADVAAGFAVLLLPYSLIGPFAGTLLDRWWRQRTLVVANAVRAVGVLAVAVEIDRGLPGVPFYASALVIISISRFLLSALSAALPRVMTAQELVTANALTATAGTLIGAAGGAIAIGARALLGDSNLDYAVIAAGAALPYALSALAATGFGRTALGPTAAERRARESPAEIYRGLLAGARHVAGIPSVRNALVAIGVHRLCYGIWTVCTLLLFRNYFHGSGLLRAGLAGLSQIVLVVAAGGGLAALATPAAFRRFGAVRWPSAMFAAAALVQLGLVLPFRLVLQLPGAFLLAFVAQAIKISVDTLVQREVADAYRGRVFALYDGLFNIALVVAAAVTAGFLPADGHSPVAVVVIAVAYAGTALGYLSAGRRTRLAAR